MMRRGEEPQSRCRGTNGNLFDRLLVIIFLSSFVAVLTFGSCCWASLRGDLS